MLFWCKAYLHAFVDGQVVGSEGYGEQLQAGSKHGMCDASYIMSFSKRGRQHIMHGASIYVGVFCLKGYVFIGCRCLDFPPNVLLPAQHQNSVVFQQHS
jgi:hypothetical protein